MKDIFVLLFAMSLLSSLSLAGQSKVTGQPEPSSITVKRFMLSSGLSFGTFQNTNFSTTTWSGIGGVVGLGFEKSTDNYSWQLSFELPYISTSASSHEGTGSILNPNFHFAYLRHLNDQIAIGGRWDIVDFYIKNRPDLGNNSTYNLQASTLYASAVYQTSAGSKKVWAGLHLGLLSFNREDMGFAFSSPQNVLEEGAFNYQDEAINNSFGFKYYELDFLSTYLNLRASIGMQLSKRSGLSYEWQMRHFSQIKGYPTTTGQHVIKFNFALIQS